jgi:putative (di)nucleoside polyphosphate hydrolase
VDAADAWQMPQGGIEPGEEPHHAAYRELREEIGTDKAEIVAESVGWHRYDLPSHIRPTARHRGWRGQEQKWFVMRFRGTDGDIRVETEHPEFSDWKWVHPSRLPELAVEFKRQIYIDLLSEFGEPHLRRTE